MENFLNVVKKLSKYDAIITDHLTNIKKYRNSRNRMLDWS